MPLYHRTPFYQPRDNGYRHNVNGHRFGENVGRGFQGNVRGNPWRSGYPHREKQYRPSGHHRMNGRNDYNNNNYRPAHQYHTHQKRHNDGNERRNFRGRPAHWQDAMDIVESQRFELQKWIAGLNNFKKEFDHKVSEARRLNEGGRGVPGDGHQKAKEYLADVIERFKMLSNRKLGEIHFQHI
jgi:hypothetical protein